MRFQGLQIVMIFLLLFLSFLYVNAQTISYQNEGGEIPEAVNPISLYAHSQTHFLPQWLFDFSNQNDSTLVTIGISDPGLKASFAEKQALTRAKAVLSLMLGSDIKVSTANYIKSNEFANPENNLSIQSKFTRLLEWQCNTNLELTNLSVIDSTTTIYGEKIIKLAYARPAVIANGVDYESITVRIEILDTEYGQNADFLNNGLLLFKTEEKSCSLRYKLYHQAQNTQLLSFCNDSLIPFKTNYYRYFSPMREKTFSDQPSSGLYHGLWKAYIESIGYLILNKTIAVNTTISYVSDDFSNSSPNTNQSFSSEALISQNALMHILFRIHELLVFENNLKLSLSFTN